MIAIWDTIKRILVLVIFLMMGTGLILLVFSAIPVVLVKMLLLCVIYILGFVIYALVKEEIPNDDE